MIILFILLCFIVSFYLVFYFYKDNNNNMKLKKEKEQALNAKIVSEEQQNRDLSDRYNKLRQKYNDVFEENENLKKRLDHKDKNIGEIKASKELQEIFEKLKEQVNINNFVKFDNLLLRDLKEPRQIDHMVICDYGIYIFETKYWEGDIYYNISKESLKGTKYEILNRYIFYKQDEKEHKTFVLKLNENGEIEYRNNGNPYKQILKTMNMLSEFLENKYFINSIVYFNYHNNNYHFINGSTKGNKIVGVNQKENLYTLLKNNMESSNYKLLDEKQIKYLEQKFKDYKI